MATFAELLTEYVNRSGISDAELARSVGVRRQTIFRWKEGIVARPRHRDDVLRCAQRLRLLPEERDRLLMSAGFAPEGGPLPSHEQDGETDEEASLLSSNLLREDTEKEASASIDDRDALTEPTTESKPRLWMMAVIVGLLLITAIWIGVNAGNGPSVAGTPTIQLTSTVQASATAIPIVARDGETLVLVGQFANFSADQGFNVSGRLHEALQAEIDAAALVSTTARIWPERLPDSAAAQRALAASRAALVIWGEYDSGRVRVHLSTAEKTDDWEKLLPSPAELSATVNVETPREVRLLAILTLGKLYRSQDDTTNARSAFRHVLELQPAQEDTIATAKFHLATVLAAEAAPDYRAAIALYDNVVALRPDWVNAHYNRGSAYLDHFYTPNGAQEDLDAAIADLTWVIQRRPGDVNAYLNRGIAYYERGLTGDINQAVTDLDRAVALAPKDPRVIFNRGLARIRRGDRDWMVDFEVIVAKNASAANAHNALCWGYALDREPEKALPHCDRGLALGLTRSIYDGRGITLAQLGRVDEAITDLQAYVDELAALPESAFIRYRGPLVEQWIDELSAGNDPFDTGTLESLR